MHLSGVSWVVSDEVFTLFPITGFLKLGSFIAEGEVVCPVERMAGIHNWFSHLKIKLFS